ncbi:KamA family radical SAM protein [Natronospora cellulosivora (SeqCode)]
MKYLKDEERKKIKEMVKLKIEYFSNLEKVEYLDEDEKEDLKNVTDKYSFRANNYYMSLIDWNDSNDPIKRIIMPNLGELDNWGALDPSNESKYTVMQGVEHKYDSTILLLVSNVCAGICRYCFRKRIFKNGHREKLEDLDSALNYIREHEEITNVLLTGGDSLMISTNRLEKILKGLREIEHVEIIRFGTKIPVFNPYRIIEDKELQDMFRKYSTKEKRLYLITDINHPKELSKEAVESLRILIDSGVILANQTPLIRKLNDKPKVLAELFKELSFIGIPSYYVFQCRPSIGNKEYAVPIEEGYKIYEKAKSMVSGLAKRSSFVLSHASGKIKILGMNDKKIFFKYHRAYDNKNSGKFFSFKRNAEAYWLDDYQLSNMESQNYIMHY